MNYIGDFAEDSTVRIALTTNDGSGGAVAPSSAFEVADFRVYKNGSATQKTSDNGITITSPFDSVVGLHILEIDTSNDTGDSGFWTTGADYWVVAVPDETVDSQTVVQVVASFSIENRIRVKATDEVSANVTKVSGSAVSTSTAQLGVNVVNAGGTAWGSGAITAAAIASNAITSAKLATDCITSAQLASTAITEIQSGLATTANVAAVETDTQDIQSRLPAALVSGRIDASVGNMESNVITSSVIATGAITASAIQTNAITDDKLAASAITEIQSGLATSAQLTTVENKVDAIDDFVDTEVAAIKGVTDKLDTTVELDGVVYRFTTNALEQAPSGGGGGGTGTGARTVTITVDDGTNPLENARVRVTNGAETYVTNTNVSGVATFNLDDATWVVSITKPGYTFAGTSLVVDGTETVTYSMSLVVITPSSVDKVTGYWTVLDETGSAAASVVVTIKARQPLRGGAGLIHDAGERTATSNGSGLVQFTNLIPGWRYAVVANDDYVADFVVPGDAVTSVELGSIVARLP